jgi:uncharacterized lipoprotein YddW (UPF0748 family)
LDAHHLARLGAIAMLGAVLACSEEAPPAAEVPAAQAPPAPAQRRALWVLAEGSQRVLDDAGRVAALLDHAQALGATDLFVQVYRGGRAWFDSNLADPAPYRASVAAGGRDALALLLERAAGRVRVHAWVNVLSLSNNAEAPIVAALGRASVLVDRRGRSLLDYPDYDVPPPDRRYYRMGTPGVYLDPAAPGVSERLAATFAELLTRYPQLDGLHLDYIRYPDVLPFVPGSRFGVGLDFGYGEPTRLRFREETGLEAPLGDTIGPADAWDDWRRDRVTALVREVATAARAARPGVAMSAAVWTYADRAYLALGQDWRRWLEEGLLDFAVPMAYTRDDRLLRYQTQAFAGLPQADRIWIGLGTWLFEGSPARALAQIELARSAPAVSLFSYDSIVASPDLLATLEADVRAGDEVAGAAD